MTTTELIEMLRGVEYGASGRAREISIYFDDGKKIKRVFFGEPKISVDFTGDGIAGAEIGLLIKK